MERTLTLEDIRGDRRDDAVKWLRLVEKIAKLPKSKQNEITAYICGLIIASQEEDTCQE